MKCESRFTRFVFLLDHGTDSKKSDKGIPLFHSIMTFFNDYELPLWAVDVDIVISISGRIVICDFSKVLVKLNGIYNKHCSASLSFLVNRLWKVRFFFSIFLILAKPPTHTTHIPLRLIRTSFQAPHSCIVL